MAVLTPRVVITLAVGIGIAAVVARRRASESCCEQPVAGASCC
jgi:hypothetical protein